MFGSHVKRNFSVPMYHAGCLRIKGRDRPTSSVGKESACNAGDLGSISGLGRSPGEGNDNPTPVFSPGESHEQNPKGSLAGYSL